VLPWTLSELAVIPIPSNPQQQSCRVFQGLSNVHEAIEAFVRRYNAHWRIQELGFLNSPGSPTGGLLTGGHLIYKFVSDQ